MTGPNRYDVTDWADGDPADDIGAVINGMIAEIKSRQTSIDENDGGKPGAVIVIPPGDYRLRTQVRIDISFLRIEGSGHGFTSSSIRFNEPAATWGELHELWPGGSRILAAVRGPAFLVERGGSPRISSVEFVGFCIDGLHFSADGSSGHPENTYRNGKTGIHVASPNDSFRVTGMGFVYLENALRIDDADALSIHDNFLAECGSCIELRGWGQASKITDNLIGAGPTGHSIYAENHGGLLVTSNNVFPRGSSSVRFRGVSRSSITNNRLHSFYPGMVVLENSSEVLVGSNHLLRDHEPWAPFSGVDNGLDDSYGLLRISGNDNSVIGNHFSEIVDATRVRPADSRPVVIRLVSGEGTFVSSNHAVGKDVRSTAGDGAFEAQVDALLATGDAAPLALTTVLVDRESIGNTILDSGTVSEVAVDASSNAFRPTPAVGA